MTALLRKDLYLISKQSWILFAIVAALSLTPQMNRFGTAYLLVLSMSLSQSAIAYDEYSRWDQFAAMLPVPAWKIVLSKYLLALGSVLGAGCLAAAVNWAQGKLLDGQTSIPLTISLVFGILLVNALFLPVIYRLGAKKSRMILAPVCFGGAALFFAAVLLKNSAVFTLLNSLVKLMEQAPLKLVFGSAALAAAGSVVSFCLSVRFYSNRRYGIYD